MEVEQPHPRPVVAGQSVEEGLLKGEPGLAEGLIHNREAEGVPHAGQLLSRHAGKLESDG